MRECSKCKISKEFSFFNKNSKNKEGFSVWCKNCMSESCRKRRLLHSNEIKKYQKQHYSINKETIIKRIKENSIIRKDEIKIYQNNYRKTYNKKNPHLMWRNVLKNSLTRLNKKKEGLTINLLGYSVFELKKHLEHLFEDGMTWENYGNGEGKWNIDYIKAVTKFDPETPPHIVNALSNLQPMWALDNLKKGNK